MGGSYAGIAEMVQEVWLVVWLEFGERKLVVDLDVHRLLASVCNPEY